MHVSYDSYSRLESTKLRLIFILTADATLLGAEADPRSKDSVAMQSI